MKNEIDDHSFIASPEVAASFHEADEVVMGASIGGDDFPRSFGMDFEFEQD